MNVFSRLWNAFGRVVESLNGLADSLDSLSLTFKEANGNARENLGLGLPAPTQQVQAALPTPTAQPEEPKKSRKSS